MSTDDPITEVPMGIDRLAADFFDRQDQASSPAQPVPFIYGRFDPKWGPKWHVFLDDRGRAVHEVRAGFFYQPALCGAFYRNGPQKRHPRVVEALKHLGTWNIAHGEACAECIRIAEKLKAEAIKQSEAADDHQL